MLCLGLSRRRDAQELAAAVTRVRGCVMGNAPSAASVPCSAAGVSRRATIVDLSGTSFMRPVVCAAGCAVHTRGLTWGNVTGQRLGDSKIAKLAAFLPHCTSLHTLKLDRASPLCTVHGVPLAIPSRRESPAPCHRTGNCITDYGARELANWLHACPRLRCVSLSGTPAALSRTCSQTLTGVDHARQATRSQSKSQFSSSLPCAIASSCARWT